MPMLELIDEVWEYMIPCILGYHCFGGDMSWRPWNLDCGRSSDDVLVFSSVAISAMFSAFGG